MNRKMSFNKMDENIKNMIIAAAYNDASFFTRRKVFKLISQNTEAKKIYDENKKVADFIHSLKDKKCPDKILKNANSKIFIAGNNLNVVHSISSALIRKPVVAFAVSLSVMLIISLAVFTKGGNTNTKYTAQQIATADFETRQVFKIIGKVFLSSQRTLEKNILGKQIGCPIRTGIKEVNNLFNSGG